MSKITTHVLDVSIGKPAVGVEVVLERQTKNGAWESLGTQTTDSDGRARDLVTEAESLIAGVHRLTFDVGPYFSDRKLDSFYNEVTIAFNVNDPSQPYHVPLLLSPFGYSTYRGS